METLHQRESLLLWFYVDTRTHTLTATLLFHWHNAAIAVTPTSSLRLDASRTPDTPEPDRATRPAAAAAAAAALSGLMAPVEASKATVTQVIVQWSGE